MIAPGMRSAAASASLRLAKPCGWKRPPVRSAITVDEHAALCGIAVKDDDVHSPLRLVADSHDRATPAFRYGPDGPSPVCRRIG